MIARLAGTLVDKDVQRLVVEAGGVGYDVHVPLSTFYAVGDIGAPVTLRIHTHVREDALQLFGFATVLELVLFQRLIAVSGIGPKLALAVLSGLEPDHLVAAIRGADLGRLTGIPGVGRKTAERLIVELRDRLPNTETGPASGRPDQADLRSDLLSALANLGYQRTLAERAVDRALVGSGPRVFEDVLRAVLKDVAR